MREESAGGCPGIPVQPGLLPAPRVPVASRLPCLTWPSLELRHLLTRPLMVIEMSFPPPTHPSLKRANEEKEQKISILADVRAALGKEAADLRSSLQEVERSRLEARRELQELRRQVAEGGGRWPLLWAGLVSVACGVVMLWLSRLDWVTCWKQQPPPTSLELCCPECMNEGGDGWGGASCAREAFLPLPPPSGRTQPLGALHQAALPSTRRVPPLFCGCPSSSRAPHSLCPLPGDGQPFRRGLEASRERLPQWPWHFRPPGLASWACWRAALLLLRRSSCWTARGARRARRRQGCRPVSLARSSARRRAEGSPPASGRRLRPAKPAGRRPGRRSVAGPSWVQPHWGWGWRGLPQPLPLPFARH